MTMGGIVAMKYVPAGTFKARCLALMKRVQATGEPLVVTKRGTPVVKVVPAQSANENIFGFLAGKVKIIGDIESPVPAEWESAGK
jgi:prevent-host-death family protein